MGSTKTNKWYRFFFRRRFASSMIQNLKKNIVYCADRQTDRRLPQSTLDLPYIFFWLRNINQRSWLLGRLLHFSRVRESGTCVPTDDDPGKNLSGFNEPIGDRRYRQNGRRTDEPFIIGEWEKSLDDVNGGDDVDDDDEEDDALASGDWWAFRRLDF